MRVNFQMLLTVVLLLAALILGNYVSTRHFRRVDLTATGSYTLSAATKKMLADVDDAITIKAYFSEKFPPAILALRRDVWDLLAEIEAAGHGKVTVEYLDPKDDQELVGQLEKLGVRPDPIQILDKDQVEAVQVYKSIVLYHADKKEVIPSLISINDLEYNIAVAIKKLSMKELPTVAFLGYKDGPSTFNELAQSAAELKKLYDVDTAVVTGGKPIPDSVKTLVVVRPKDLTPRECYEVDQFLMRGGKAFILVDGMTVDVRQNPPVPSPVTSGMEEMLEAYGVKVNKDLVYDVSCERVQVQVRPGMRMASMYPPLVSAVYQNFDRSSPIVSRISQLVLPWVSSLELTASARDGKTVAELIKSTEQAWTPQPPEVAPDKIKRPEPTELKQCLLAVSLAGKFKSAWAGKPEPPEESAPPPTAKPEPKKERKDEGETRIVVVGDADFVMPDFNSPGGTRFMLNAVDWLTLDDSLIQIRTKSDKVKPFPKFDDTQRTWFRAINIGLAPVVITVLGFVRFFFRRRRIAAAAA
ncbi:MAG: GldG family protein [Acidobacteriota bacterium]